MRAEQGIVATILQAFRGERSLSGVYHLLTGKKSAQTLQDASFFAVTSYFGIFPRMKREQLNHYVNELVENGFAIEKTEECYVLTEQGRRALSRFQQKWPSLQYLNGWHYNVYMPAVWLRLCLLIQSLSHLVVDDFYYYPVTHDADIQHWVKRHIKREKEARKEQLKQLYAELTSFLSTCSHIEAFIFVHQLSGKEKTGLTLQQLAQHLKVNISDVYLTHLIVLHKLFNKLEEERSALPQLFLFIADLRQNMTLTESARKTFDLLKKGYSIKTMSRLRHLKENTIEDHLVEIALQTNEFPFRDFVDEQTEALIVRVANEQGTTRLRDIKEQLPEYISYFMIRLVLTRKKVSYAT